MTCSPPPLFCDEKPLAIFWSKWPFQEVKIFDLNHAIFVNLYNLLNSNDLMLQVSEFVILRLVCSLFYGLETLVATLHYSQDGQASLPSAVSG